MKYFRPRFSVRTLAIVVTLVCAYFGAWEATNRYATFDHNAYTMDGSVVASTSDGGIHIAKGSVTVVVIGLRTPTPLVMIQDELVFDSTGDSALVHERSLYYFWLFGPKIKLPFESKRLPSP